MELRLVTPATADIVTLPEAKAHLRVLDSADDEYIGGLCDAVRDHLAGENGWLGVSIVPQTWELTLSRFPCGNAEWPPAWQPMQTGRPRNAMPLPRPPLISVSNVYYTPANGAEVELTGFRTIGATTQAGAYLMPAKGQSWPATDDEPGSVRIRYTAGYATLPRAIKHAALLLIGHWYENREGATEAKMNELPMAVHALLAPYRNYFS